MPPTKRQSLLPLSMQIRRTTSEGAREGLECCGVCRICTCVKWGLLCTPIGIVKTAQIILSLVCQLLLYFYGLKHSFQMSGGGLTYFIFMMISSAVLINSFVLIVTYVCSQRSRAMIRPTIYEVFHNALAATLYTLAACFLAVNTQNLFYYDRVTPETFHAMTAAYVIGFIAAIIHFLDSVMAFRDYKRIRVV